MQSKNIIPQVIIALFLNVCSTFSQDTQGMFVYQVDGNKYEKVSYDKKGKILNTQKIEAGIVQKKGSNYLLPVKIFSYDANGKLKDTYETNYICEPSENKLFMHVFPLSDKQKYTNVSVRLLSENDFYPIGKREMDALPDISFSMDIQGGLLGFFGANSKINISERKIFNEEKEPKNYRINEKVEIKAYILGVKIRTINYTVTELFNPVIGILKQEFKESSGELFTITLFQS